MKLPVSKGKYVLDKEQLQELFVYIYEKGLQNGIIVEAGIGVDRTQEELGVFMLAQSDPAKKTRQKKETLPKNDLSRPIADRKKEFAEKLSKYKTEYPSESLKEFYYYWIEHNEGENVMRFEKTDTFNIELRLKRFRFRSKGLNGQNKQEKKQATIDKYKSAYDRLRENRGESAFQSQPNYTDEGGYADEVTT